MELLPLVGIVLLFWLFIIRPTSRRQKQLRSMQSSLTVGDEVMLTSGVFGTVRDLAEERVRVEIADGVEISVIRGAIGSKVEPVVASDVDLEDPATDPATGPADGPANGAVERTEES